MNYSMPKYFQNMPQVGKALANIDEANENAVKEIEAAIADSVAAMQDSGTSDEKIHDKGQMTALERVAELVDEGTWYPLNTLYNPENFETGTGIVKGLGRIGGKWAVVVASDNKKIVGAWVPGQADNLLRASDTAKCLGIPLVYVLNCSGVKLDEQEKVYANRRGGGTPFFRNAELQQLGIPVIVGIYGTNPASRFARSPYRPGSSRGATRFCPCGGGRRVRTCSRRRRDPARRGDARSLGADGHGFDCEPC